MTPPTPPPTTYDHKPAYDFAQAMRPRADFDGKLDGVPIAPPSWYEWALVEAYMAGRAAAMAEVEKYREALMQVGRQTKWVGWMELQKTTGHKNMTEIKRIVEEATGVEFEEYT